RHGVLGAGLYGREILPRHRAAVHPLGEDEALAASPRGDFDHDVAELAMPARLLLVPAAHCDGVADRLAIGDGRLVGVYAYPEPVGEALGRHPKMHLALTEELHLGHFRVLDEAERRVL